MATDVPTRLWPEIDRIALCVHRRSGRHPAFRAVADAMRIPAGSIVVVAARHLAVGTVTLRDVELLSRYESHALVARNVEDHVSLGLLRRRDDGGFSPSAEFQDLATIALQVQSDTAGELWSEHAAGLADLRTAAERLVNAGTVSAEVPHPAFDAQVAARGVLPAGDPSQILGRVTELRYLRADLHAAALAEHGLAGPRARALHRLAGHHSIEEALLPSLVERGLASTSPTGPQITPLGRQVSSAVEARTNELTDATLATVTAATTERLLEGLLRLPGDDPRPTADR